MRAQRLYGRRSAHIKAGRRDFVNSNSYLHERALGKRYERILVSINENGAPFGLERRAVIGRIRHRHHVGFSVGVRPAGTLPSPEWSANIRSLGLDVVEYAVGGDMADARLVSGFEVQARTLRLLYRDSKVDAVLIVAPTFPLEPLAHAVHSAGRTLIVADMAERLGRWERVADGVFAIDSFIVAECL